ncbi:hypothetical protein [Streptomyces spinoverrucosus]|uniref:hypothetical protein n=1 Tax=Streptomyces spinoverrucosus TaxID=284043 RepID=UPI0018C44BF6|nr:hypothetical protein [Streptomyces spinoverrucosus]
MREHCFCHRGRLVGKDYLNNKILPALCRKSEVPHSDSHDALTSHRARATIATQLLNAREPLTLVNLQQWLGTIQVLIDRESIRTGAATGGEQPWKYYDLGDGYCGYDFFAKCPHRLACAHCPFYVPNSPPAANSWPSRTASTKCSNSSTSSTTNGRLSKTTPRRSAPDHHAEGGKWPMRDA